MPAAEFELKVQFRNYLTSKDTCPYEIRALNKFAGVVLHVGHYQKPEAKGRPTTVRLDHDHAIAQFKIVDEGGRNLYPIGMMLTRADGTPPLGAPFTSGVQPVLDSPFTMARINEPVNTVEIGMTRKKVHSKVKGSEKRSHTTYRFAVFVQDLDTGEVGLIDPEIENPN